MIEIMSYGEVACTNLVKRATAWNLLAPGGIGGLLEITQGGQRYYPLYDGKGNVTTLLDANQSVAASYAYDPFGLPVAKSGVIEQPYRFSSKMFDEKTGLSYFGYRYYLPLLGRWLNRDPLGEAGGINLYAFVQNNSVNYVDPYGLWRTHPRYGNWGGEAWSGGTTGSEGPTDSMDACFKQHDHCYDDINKVGICSTRKNCDKELVACLYGLPANSSDWMHPPSNPIYAGFYRTWALSYFQTQY